ncbi:MAG: hypothetical protein IJ416_09240 [Ruminiclostridium sp.]|nr:hypothetical protein [Ruminiclostridium sp.]
MAKRKTDGLSVAIVILNVLIVGVIITLCVLIYLYMSGKLEQTDVSNLGQAAQTSATTTTTQITTVPFETTAESTSSTTTTTEPVFETTGDGTDETIVAVETDIYDTEFYADDLFIGDSIATGLLNYGYLNSDQVYAQIGLNPESAHATEYDGYTAVTRAEELQPKRIYIMLGSNGLAYMGNTYMVEQTQILIEKIKEVTPDSYIYLISIPPVTKAHESEGQETMAMVNGYNKLLKELADEIGVIYLDLCSELQDSTGYFSDAYAEADGLHFLGTAYKKMLSFIQKSIQE